MSAPSPFVVLLISAAITCASLVLGGHLLKHRLQMSQRPVLGSFIGGILVGIALLVLLAEGAEQLVEHHGWSMRHVLLVFVGTASSLFLLEHCVLGHEHAPALDTPILAALDAAPPPEVAMAPMPAPEPSTSTALQCEPCEAEPVMTFATTSKQRRQRKLFIDEEPGSATRVTLSGQLPCECCEEPGLPERESADRWRLTRALCPHTPRALAALRVFSEATRLLAWMVHSFLDGVALGSSDSTGTLLPLALAMLVCTLQDTSAFCACLRRGSRLHSLLALLAFSLTFPLGALVSLWSMRRVGASPKALDVARVVMAAFFVYMALFEMAPPHTHARLRNCTFLLAFVAGVSVAAATDVLEGVFSGG